MPSNNPDQPTVMKNVLSTNEVDVVLKQALGLSSELTELLLNVTYLVCRTLHKLFFPLVPESEIFMELLPGLCGAASGSHNWHLITQRLESIGLSKHRETGNTFLVLSLFTKDGRTTKGFSVVVPWESIWDNNDEVIHGKADDLLVIYPTEVVCQHNHVTTASSCKPGHTHRSIFHLGDDALKKFHDFEDKADLIVGPDDQQEEHETTEVD
jgi:hypothetical protein